MRKLKQCQSILLIIFLAITYSQLCYATGSITRIGDNIVVLPSFQGFKENKDPTTPELAFSQLNAKENNQLFLAQFVQENKSNTDQLAKLITFAAPNIMLKQLASNEEWEELKREILDNMDKYLAKGVSQNSIDQLNKNMIAASNNPTVNISKMDIGPSKSDKVDENAVFTQTSVIFTAHADGKDFKFIAITGISILNLKGIVLLIYVYDYPNSAEDTGWVKQVSLATIKNIQDLNANIAPISPQIITPNSTRVHSDYKDTEISSNELSPNKSKIPSRPLSSMSAGELFGGSLLYLTIAFIMYSIINSTVLKGKYYIKDNFRGIRYVFLNMYNFKKNASRLEFVIGISILLGILMTVTFIFSLNTGSSLLEYILYIYAGIFLYASLCLIANRLHDIGQSRWFSILAFIPYIQILFTAILMFYPSKKSNEVM